MRPSIKVMPVVNVIAMILVILSCCASCVIMGLRAVSNKEPYAIAFLPVVTMANVHLAFAIKAILASFAELLFIHKYKDIDSLYYSCHRTPRDVERALPPVVCMVPVYTEPFEDVIQPTLDSVRVAIDMYAAIGGVAKLVVCEDGLQALPQSDAAVRVAYYTGHDVAYVARPLSGRRGKFKKASNMNYCLTLGKVFGKFKEPGWQDDEAWRLCKVRCSGVVGAGDPSLDDGSILLLLDCDTRVPKTCLVDVIPEFVSDTSIAYVQHSMRAFGDQMNTMWERMISHSTARIYERGIADGTALGDPAPIVGHNVYIRWRALDTVTHGGEFDTWAPDKVSEDFALFLQLAIERFPGRYATYSNGFEEGISSTYIDEVNKLRKFTYGVFEMAFNPCARWPGHGPFNMDFVKFLVTRDVPLNLKLCVTFYMTTYLAMAWAFPLLLFESVFAFVLPDFYERYLWRSLDVCLACSLVFWVVPFLCDVSRWRSWRAVRDSVVHMGWSIPHGIFVLSSMMHATIAMLGFFGSFDRIVWGATPKKAIGAKRERLQDMQMLLRCQWPMFLVMTMCFGTFVSLAIVRNIGFYRAWGMPFYTACHILAPVAFTLAP